MDNDTIFRKAKKTWFFATLGQFCPFLGKNELSHEIGLCPFLDFTIIYHHVEKPRKN